MKIYEKPSLDIESLMVRVAVATYADVNDYPTDGSGNETELSDDFWGDLFNPSND